MKELSIEEKAKRYDEILARAKGANLPYYKKGIMSKVKEFVDYLIPELKESEGERIRKAIINEISLLEKESVIEQEKNVYQSWIAWLEKKGEQHKIQPKFKIGDIIRFKGNETLKGETETHKIISYDNELYVFADGTTDLFCEQDLYELVEQKPADKVEPKFNVGDFIVNDYCMGKVIELTHDAYLLDTGQGIPFSCEHNAHLWTIQDAKDGDVLAIKSIEGYHSPFVAIYKKQNEEDFDSYCFIGFDGKFYKGENGHSTEEVHPATKEQNDLLFQKMKESGYEWDAEKKQLKKIEQNPAWSEEDKEMRIKVLKYLSTRCNVFEYEEVDNWLKSIRPQSQWKPSDEQMEALEWQVNNTSECSWQYKESKNLLKQLKKLMEE